MQTAVDQLSKRDVREVPAYTYPEASRAVNIPRSTLRAWVRGQTYRRKEDTGFFEPVIQRPDADDPRLSFTNLIEAHVLRALRTTHDVSMAAVREALDVAESEFGIERLLIHRQLRTSAGDLFLDRYHQIVTLSKSQQLVMRQMFEKYLARVEYDETDLPEKFFPLTEGPLSSDSPRIIALTPYVSFGRPVVLRRGVSTSAIRSRFDAGESVEHIAADYGLEESEVQEAVRYEVAA